MNTAPPIEISLSRIAHDLRGPLMPLRTAAWLLRQEQGAPARIMELADIVDRQSIRLARMMDELSEWGRETGGDGALNCTPVEVALAVDMALGSLPACSVQPAITDEAIQFPLHANVHHVVQVLRTLIEHAMHRATGTQVELAVGVVSGMLRILVRDRGAPLDAVAREALLARPQANPFDEGLGLRLLLARRTAEAHGGSLEIDPMVDDGLAFIFSLPPSAGSGPTFVA